MHIFVRLLAKICAHLCAFLKIFDVRIFVRLLAKICAHLSLELLNTLFDDLATVFPELVISYEVRNFEESLVTKNLSS